MSEKFFCSTLAFEKGKESGATKEGFERRRARIKVYGV